jgi:hypothetical protein
MKVESPARLACVCFFAVLALFMSCAKDIGKPLEPASGDPLLTGPLTGITKDACDTVSYSATIRPIVTKVCLGCHGDLNPSAGFSLNSFNLLKAKAQNGRLAARVLRGDGGFMPQGRAMSADTLSLFNCWIKNGCKP